MAKLNGYWSSYKSIKLILSFLLERRFRTKTNLEHSDLEDLLIDVPWGSVLGHLLLNNYMCEFFLFIIELNIANHADDLLSTIVKQIWLE